MREPRPAQREPGGGFETALVAVGGLVLLAGFTTWEGARLATAIGGGRITGGIDVWLRATVRLARGQSPAQAWGDAASGLPATALYWACTATVAIAVAAAVTALIMVWRRVDGDGRRRRFGQDTQAREATPADVRPLVIDHVVPPTGRMLLGRIAGRRQLLATEDRTRHPLTGRAARRQGNRGSVALIGPTGSGKTALATAAIATWDGPVVAVSVKRDLYDATATVRAAKGEIAVFDPGAATNLPTARWSPLTSVSTSSGALRTGRALAQAIPRSGVTNAEYWAKHGEKLLCAFMCLAGLSQHVRRDDESVEPPVSIEQVAAWVTAMAIANEPTINTLLRKGLGEDRPLEVKLMARHAATTFAGVAKEDHKIRSSIYATAALALDPWLEPSVAHSASDSPRPFYWSDDHYQRRPRHVDLDWLMAGEPGHANTLYLTASQPEFERLSPVLGGLLADLKDTIHAWDIAGHHLDKPLLFVIDEAGQLELGWLPAEVSTIAALGAFFVTCWQSLSQIQHRYTSLADAVLSGHRTKCFFAGIDDLATVHYLTGLLGHEQVTRWSTSRDIPALLATGGHLRRSVSQTVQREEFAPANTLRQMYPGEAVLLHGTLPPVHLDAVRWWQENELRGLVPLGDDGNPTPPGDLPTCPLGDASAGEPGPAVDPATLHAALAQLPTAPPPRSQHSSEVRIGGPSDIQATSAEVAPNPPARRPTTAGDEPVSGRCDLCGQRLRPGEGAVDRQGRRIIIRCTPSCVARRRANTSAP
jgi:type IV secretion system protein VirD4